LLQQRAAVADQRKLTRRRDAGRRAVDGRFGRMAQIKSRHKITLSWFMF
jgi:hypothetical protein